MPDYWVRYWDKARDEHPATAEVLSLLASRYDAPLLARFQRTAPSVVWRSECEFVCNPELPRFCRRVHLFELGTAAKVSEDHHVRYRGFVHLRPQQHGAGAARLWISDALLSPPERLLRPPWHLAGVGAYGDLYGEGQFPCVPFSVPGQSTGGRCAQACLFQATLMATRFGGVPLAPFDFTVALEQTEHSQDEWREVEGLRFEDILRALDSLDTGEIEGILDTRETLVLPPLKPNDEFEPEDFRQDVGRSFLRLNVKSYLEAGLPLILPVNFRRLHGEEAWRRADPGGTSHEEDGSVPHAVMVLGFKEDAHGLTFLLNDSAVAPFVEVSEDQLCRGLLWDPLEDATVLPDEVRAMGATRIVVRLMVPVPRPVNVPIFSCIERLDIPRWRTELVSGASLLRVLARIALENCGLGTDSDRVIGVAERLAPAMGDLPSYSWVFTGLTTQRTLTSTDAPPVCQAFSAVADGGHTREVFRCGFNVDRKLVARPAGGAEIIL